MFIFIALVIDELCRCNPSAEMITVQPLLLIILILEPPPYVILTFLAKPINIFE
jgi:hypothetical protein